MEKNYLNSSDKLSLKEEYKKAAGKKVPTDYFIYTCMAEDHSFQTLGEGSEPLPRWPLLAERRSSGKLDDPTPDQSFEDSVRELIRWYAENHTELSGSDPLDYALCSIVIPKFIIMVNDIRQLVFIKQSKGLPQIPADEDLPSVWESLNLSIRDSFPNYSDYMIAFFKWVYAKPVERNVILKDLPPVGRYFNLLRDNLRSKDKSTSRGPAESSEESVPTESFNSDEVKPPTRKHSIERNTEPRESSPHRERGDRGGDRDRDKRGHDRGQDSEDKSNKDKEKLALLEVDKAILTLKKHSSMNEFRLRPQNSFIRRLQHKKINALGFQSHSVGEDENRAVLITREET